MRQNQNLKKSSLSEKPIVLTVQRSSIKGRKEQKSKDKNSPQCFLKKLRIENNFTWNNVK